MATAEEGKHMAIEHMSIEHMASEEDVARRATEAADEAPKKVEAKGPETRCNPGIETELISKFPLRVSTRLQQLNLIKMAADMKLTALHYRKTCIELLARCVVHEDSNQVELKIKDDKSAWITEKVVQHVLDLPQGTNKKFEPANAADVTEEYNKMVDAVKLVVAKHPEERRRGKALSTQEETKKALMTPENIGLLFAHCDEEDIVPHAKTDMLVRLYLATVHDRFLLPGTTSYVSRSAVKNVYHLEKLCELDWAYLVFNALKKASKAQDTSYMKCCVAVLLVSTTSCCK
jgi:hypothetical protein